MKRAARLELARCLDDAHDWQLVSKSIEQKGKLKGTARREKLCRRCSGLKVEHLAWDGRVLNRTYKSDPEYIKASRELAKDPSERRMEFRKQWLKHEFSNSKVAQREFRAITEEETR